jgi:hypothetical protein
MPSASFFSPRQGVPERLAPQNLLAEDGMLKLNVLVFFLPNLSAVRVSTMPVK